MSSAKPSKDEATKVMLSYQNGLGRQFQEDWLKRNIKNNFREALISRLIDLVKKDGDDKEEEKERQKIKDELKRRRAEFKLPEIQSIKPRTIQTDGFYASVVGPAWDYVWAVNGSSFDNGAISISFSDVENATGYAAGGVGTWFNPPVAGLWSFEPRITYNYDWLVSNAIFGGASTNAFFAITVYTYVNGQYQSENELRYPLWNAGVGPGLVSASLQDNNSNVAENPLWVGIPLSPGNGYLIWTWFGINIGAGPGAIGWASIGASVSSMLFECVY
jgi:hypothetical protein